MGVSPAAHGLSCGADCRRAGDGYRPSWARSFWRGRWCSPGPTAAPPRDDPRVGVSSPMRGVRRRVLADAAWGHIRSTDTTHTLCQDHSCGGTSTANRGDDGSTPRWETAGAYAPCGRRAIARRGGLPAVSQADDSLGTTRGPPWQAESLWRAARPRSTASFGCRQPCYRPSQTCGNTPRCSGSVRRIMTSSRTPRSWPCSDAAAGAARLHAERGRLAARAWRTWGLCRGRHLLDLHVRIPLLEHRAQFTVECFDPRLQ